MIRDLNLNDLIILEKDGTLPNEFDNPCKLSNAIEYKNELIGAFWVRLTTESSLIFRPNLNNITRARALDEAVRFLKREIPNRLGIKDSLIIFRESFNSQYINFLKRNYNSEEFSKVLRIQKDA